MTHMKTSAQVLIHKGRSVILSSIFVASFSSAQIVPLKKSLVTESALHCIGLFYLAVL